MQRTPQAFYEIQQFFQVSLTLYIIALSEKIRNRVLKHLDRLVDLESSHTSSIDYFLSERLRVQEMQNLIGKQDEMIKHLQDRNATLDQQILKLNSSKTENDERLQ